MHYVFFISLLILVVYPFLHLLTRSREMNDERNECNGYREIERQVNCGHKGYLIRYGIPNCERFSRSVEKGLFDKNGAQWVKCTSECLIQKLFDIYESNPDISCSSIEQKAFDTHVSCYLDCNFCTICRSQKWGLLATYQFSDFLNLKSISQVYDVISQCGLFHCFT